MKNKNIQEVIKKLQNDSNNAIAYVFEDATLKNSGILANNIFTVKDNYADENTFSMASSKILRNFKPAYKSTVIKLLEEAGASCVARTNLDEFGLGGSGEYSAFGIIKNPLNDNHLVGGSSSGAAATFYENIDFAIGSDTGDSVRKPASNIGCIGFKPSYGAVSRYGLFAFATSLDTVAYFTHSVEKTALLSSVLYKQDLVHDLSSIDLSFDFNQVKKIKPKKVAYLDCFDELTDHVKASYQDTLKKLANSGIELIKINVDEKLLKSIDVVYKIIAFSEASSNLANLTGVEFGARIEGKNWKDSFIKTRSEGLGKMVQSRLILGSYFLKSENQIKYFVKAKRMRRYLTEYFSKIHKQADCFIYPASNDSAPLIGKEYRSSYMDYILTYANLVGNPSLTLKMGEDSNKMPFNLTIDTEIYSDKKLFDIALYFEELLGENHA
ncbi:amidase family protein [Mycoplasma phocoeninasale]|uniref:Asp-tRNA(Asn)/Glu-tRNA(Gln) amidotransferase subunit GatA n=1 Tax=Mycoplasma phocoeninasale TaxID=2726117 RepID=A0A858U3E5_9MOLU|nr:amidase family protein [Mycoplasma phocoeninasale]MBN0970952.1 Asp-tRNA(Asn)/Glu-tRNA(Gln) amidotransferase subunit GatA [Mycoplasma phocoeninasale]QJG66511.1 Asp-tRNA(Asn)/Glu-tRNA(Gln) amidotransferase subunit GatA [Mycoplasma phocoeninasale]